MECRANAGGAIAVTVNGRIPYWTYGRYFGKIRNEGQRRER